MLRFQLSRTLLVSHSLLFITAPSVSHVNFHSSGLVNREIIGPNNSASADAQKMVMNKQVKLFVSSYIKKNNSTLNRIKRKNAATFRMMDSVFTLYRLPVELKYLAVVESELKPKALSRVGAVGPWQLMPETARIFGLKTARHNDERTQYFKSTRVAARYLKELYGEFGDWLLVFAAYNAGRAPVYRAIHKAGSRNFYDLQYFLPAESRGHVKKYIATHYYFEGKGSVTTLTKSERVEYTRAMAVLASNSNN